MESCQRRVFSTDFAPDTRNFRVLRSDTKMRTLRLLLTLFALGSAAVLSADNYPFPMASKLAYSYGVKPPSPSATSWSADYTALQSRYSSWISAYRVTASGASVAGSTVYRIQRPEDSDDSVSEGIGYGMILAVYFDDQATFNGLYNYVEGHLDGLGLMNWQISSGGSTIGANSASDGDDDICYALFLAHYQWGDGTYSYLTWAKNMLNLIEGNDVDANERLKPGDSFDSCQYPSYYMPNEWTVFGKQGGNAGLWSAVTSNSYSTLAAARNSTSGLIAEQTSTNGTGGGCSVSSTQYLYNSCRVPFYMALDYIYYDTTNSSSELKLLQSFFGSIAPGSVDDGYTVSSNSACSYNTNEGSFVGPAGCSLMGTTSAPSELETYYTTLMGYSVSSGNYYSDTWTLLSLLLMQGNMPNLADPSTIFTPTPTPTNTTFAGTPTMTATVTPVISGVIFEDFEAASINSPYGYESAGGVVPTEAITTTVQTVVGGTYANAMFFDVSYSAGYAGVGFQSNYANNIGVVDAAGTTAVSFSVYSTTAPVTFTISFQEGGTTITPDANGGHGIEWTSASQSITQANTWITFKLPVYALTWNPYQSQNGVSLPSTNPGYTIVLASMKQCQIQSSTVTSSGYRILIDNIEFDPTAAFTPTPTVTPFTNPYTEIFDDFESSASLNPKTTPQMGAVFYDISNNASASLTITSVSGDYVDGGHGLQLTYNTGNTSSSYGCGASDISPYGVTPGLPSYQDDSGAVLLSFWLKAPAGLKYRMEYQEAGNTGTGGQVNGGDGAEWMSQVQTSTPGANGWQYVELPLGSFEEDPYNALCNPASVGAPGPCLSEGDTQQLQAVKSVTIKLVGDQLGALNSGVLYMDDIAFITTWKTPTPTSSPSSTATPTHGSSPTNSPTSTATPSPSPSPSPTSTGTPSNTPTASPSDSPTGSPSNSPSSTATPSATPAGTATPTPTFTNFAGSPTSTWSVSASPTYSQSSTNSPTYTPTLVLTATPSGSATTVVSETNTPASSFTNTPGASATNSPVSSSTNTPGASFTNTPGSSETNTPVASATNTPANSATNTPAASSTNTPGSSATNSPANTATPTPSNTSANTGTATVTATYTTTAVAVPTIGNVSLSSGSGGTEVLTVTGGNFATGDYLELYYSSTNVTVTVSAASVAVLGSTTITASVSGLIVPFTVTVFNSTSNSSGYTYLKATPTPGSGGVILSHVPLPNPNPKVIYVELGTSVDYVEVRVYAENLVYVGSGTTMNVPAGWQPVLLPGEITKSSGGAADGLYYYKVIAHKNGGTLDAATIGKLYLSR